MTWIGPHSLFGFVIYRHRGSGFVFGPTNDVVFRFCSISTEGYWRTEDVETNAENE